MVAAVVILLAFYFGWRSSTAAALCLSDVVLDRVEGIYSFSERFSKGVFGGSRRFRILQLPVGLLVGVDYWLPHFMSCLPLDRSLLGVYFH
jgi:hypothetical protein